MKKKFVCIGLIAVCSVMLIGCGKNKSLTIKADTGDVIDVSIDKSGGYSLEKSGDSSFLINRKGEQLCTGSFVTEEYYVMENGDNIFRSYKYKDSRDIEIATKK